LDDCPDLPRPLLALVSSDLLMNLACKLQYSLVFSFCQALEIA